MFIIADTSKKAKYVNTFLISSIVLILPSIATGPALIPISIIASLLTGIVAVLLPTDRKLFYIPLSIFLTMIAFIILIAVVAVATKW